MSAPGSQPHPTFSALLREWRRSTGLSQLQLATRCGSSQRHISFLESGRSNPSRLMIFALSEALEIPLRDRNELLLAAGFAPRYQRSSLDDPAMAPVKSAIDRILEQNEPYPALVFDQVHDILAANEAAIKLNLFLFNAKCSGQIPAFAGNLLRAMLHPQGYRRHIVNWHHVASIMLRRLRAEALAAGKPQEALALLEEVTGYCGIPDDWQHYTEMDWRRPTLTIDFRKNGEEFSVFSTLSTLGAPFDITLQEVRIESFFPADGRAARFFAEATSRTVSKPRTSYLPGRRM